MRTFRLRWHRLLLVAMDGLFVNAALLIAFWLRLEDGITPHWSGFYHSAALWLTPLTLIACYAFGLYNRVWEYARGDAAVSIFVAVSSAMLLGSLAVATTRPPVFSRSVLFMTWLIAMLLIGGSRLAWRQMRRHLRTKDVNGSASKDRRRVLIYGAGYSGTTFASQLAVSVNSPYQHCGYVDDNPALKHMLIGHHRVLGTGDDLPALVKRLGIDEVILALPSVSGEQLRAMRRRVEAAGAKASTLPRSFELPDSEATTAGVRPIRFQDLLRREMTDVSLALEPDYVGGRTVLVTGAGGSIGSEICRQLCRYAPKHLILLGRGENRIHNIFRELTVSFPEIEFTPTICNFTNAEHVDAIFEQYHPEVVFHAGAHKHVYLMEDCPAEAVRNNVLGTATVACAADRHGVDRFVAISTDKAVEPISVMGATKRLCEILLTRLNEHSSTKFTVVRFGNVLGSAGSVLTIWNHQAASGWPLTVTHRQATRYFMAVEEAAFLVLQAGALGNGGDIFVLEMGEPVCVYQVAREFLEMYGRDPDAPGAIEITTLCRGEKLHERLCRSSEELAKTRCPYVNRAIAKGPAEVPWSHLEIIARAREVVDDPEAAAELLRTVCRPGDREATVAAAAGS